MAPKRCLEPVNIIRKRVFEDVIKLSIMRWGHYPGISGRALNVITSVPMRGDLTQTKEEKAV